MGTSSALLIGLLTGLVAGLLLGFLIAKNLTKGATSSEIDRQRLHQEQNEAFLKKQLGERDADLSRFQRENTSLTGQLSGALEREKALEKQYGQMNADLKIAFGDLAAQALRANSTSFLEFAKQELGKQSGEAKAALEAKELAIKQLLQPLEISLKALDEKTQAMELARAGAYGGLEALVSEMKTSLPQSLEVLRRETSQLINALRAPKARGNWGELQLRRCVEYAGMLNYCSFYEQVSTRNDDERLLQPDMVIQLPNGRKIVVDAKTPLDAFLDSAVDDGATTQASRFLAHAQRVKSHLKDLAGKAYWKQFEPAPEFVVCFLPSEALFSAALEAEPSLIEFSADARVILATPTTLIALLKAVAYGWQQSEITQSAKAIQETGKALYGKLANAHEHFSRLGTGLMSAVKNYNNLVGSVEGRSGVFFQARKLGELVHSHEELEQVEVLPAEQRALVAEDWVVQSNLSLAASGADTESES